MNHLSRRLFIQGAGSALALYSLALDKFEALTPHVNTRSQGLGKMIGASPQSAESIDKAYLVQNNLFFNFDLDTGAHREMEIPQGLSHDTLLHHNWKSKALVIEKDGPYSCIVEYNQMQLVQKITAPQDYLFSGSGIFSPSGDLVYIGAINTREKQGYALVFDTENFELKNSFPTEGVAPSSFIWMNPNTILISHYGAAPNTTKGDNGSCISIYEKNLNKVIDKIQPPDPNLYLCQMQLASNGKLFILTHDPVKSSNEHADTIREIKSDYNRWVTERPYFHDNDLEPSPLLVLDTTTDKKSYSVNHTEGHFRWGLSLSINEKYNVAGGTHAHGRTLTFQNIETGELMSQHVFENENPRALSLSADKNYFIATTDAGNIHFFDAKTRALTRTEKPLAHRYNYLVHAKCVT